MPEYLAPGVYVEETSFRSKSIEGVSTTTTGLIGPSRFGPITETPDILTSLGEFERVYGGGEQLEFGASKIHNYLWHAARGFFSEGGKRLYVSRIFRPLQGEYASPGESGDAVATKINDLYVDGHARAILGGAGGLIFRARFPGKAGNYRLRATVRLGPNLLKGTQAAPITSGAEDKDLVYVLKPGSSTDPVTATLTTETDKLIAEVTKIADFVKAFGDKANTDAAAAATAAATAPSAAAAADLVDVAQRNANEAIVADAIDTGLRESINVTQASSNAVKAAQKEQDAATAAVVAAGVDLEKKAKAEAIEAQAKIAVAQAVSRAIAAANNLIASAANGAAKTLSANQVAATAALQAALTARDKAILAAGKAVLVGTFCAVSVAGAVKTFTSISNQTITPDPTSDRLYFLNISLEAATEGLDGFDLIGDGLALDQLHLQNGFLDNLFSRFRLKPSNAALARTLPIVVLAGANISDALKALNTLFNLGNLNSSLSEAIKNKTKPEFSSILALGGGNDGLPPQAGEYEGKANPDQPFKTGLKQFEDLEDISIVAAPGSSAGYNDSSSEPDAIIQQLLIHASHMRYRIAVLDSGDNQSISSVREMRAKFDSTYGALYYPWVRVLDPITRNEIHLPPSGFVAGIYARNDINRAVFKAPANEVVNLALGFELFLNKGQQDVLNPEGINCFRFFEGRGMLLWGARTISSDPEWKYVNLRRYFAYLERSIDKGTQWAVFEPNGNLLWDNVRRTIEDFLFNEFQMGALLGDKPERAFFVKCDRTTMTQNDLDNGRLVCLIGVAPLRPAEFVIFRIGQWTGDRKV